MDILLFKNFDYVRVKFWDEYVYVELNGWYFEGYNYLLIVGFYDGRFKVWINVGNFVEYLESLVLILDSYNFELFEEFLIELVNDELSSLDVVMDLILRFCNEFKGFVSE